MKAVSWYRYGTPKTSLKIIDMDIPKPAHDEVLIKVVATTVSTADSRLRASRVPFGFKFLTRLIFGLSKPKKEKSILGIEYAGEIAAIGDQITEFAVGDHVFGSSPAMGCHQEYITLKEKNVLEIKPKELSFEEACAIPFGGLTSLVYLRDFGKIQAGDQVLINGASGALGVYAVQLCKHFGAKVTAICSTKNVSLVKSLGAHEVLDYTSKNFKLPATKFDIIYDTIGTFSFIKIKSHLHKNGRFLMAVAGIFQYFHVFYTHFFSKQKAIANIAAFRKEDLQTLIELYTAGKITPVIDNIYPLEQIVDAHKRVDSGHKRGAVVVTFP